MHLLVHFCIHIVKARFTWMACHVMHAHRHRREENLHFSNSFTEKPLLPFPAASERDHRSLGTTLLAPREHREQRAACSLLGQKRAGRSLPALVLLAEVRCAFLCLQEVATDAVQNQFSLLKAESERPSVAGQQKQMFILCQAWLQPVSLRCCPWECTGWLCFCLFWVIRLSLEEEEPSKKGKLLGRAS